MGHFSSPKYIHMVGIKGVGMTALAQVLHNQGHHISGSDVPETFFTDNILVRLGIDVKTQFGARNVPPRTQILIHSAAYSASHNPEITEALSRGIRILVYPEALGELSKDYYAIGVSGTHGKSTVTAMLGHCLVQNSFDPTVIVGTQVPAFGNMNARTGKNNLLVAETCEYRRHFLHYSPNLIVITNIEAEHLDYFRDIDDVENAFLEYVERLTPWRTSEREKLVGDKLIAPVGVDPTLVICIDDKIARGLIPRFKEANPAANIVTYGLNQEADCHASNLRVVSQEQLFDVTFQGKKLGNFALKVPGEMNVQNALASIAATFSLPSTVTGKVPTFSATKQALGSFSGTTRRFEIRGVVNGLTVIDDYAHHPTELRAALKAARQFYPNARIWADFMSHTYSRTKSLLPQFGESFQDADVVIVNHIYASARELPDPEINGKILADEISKHHGAVKYIQGFPETVDYLLGKLRQGDVLITFGAGDNWRIGEDIINRLNSN